MSDKPNKLSPLKQAFLRIEELEAELRIAKGALSEPVAIVGIGCRFPGGVDNPESYWQLLENGVDAISEVPPDRWNIDDYFDPDQNAPGKMSTRWAGFLPAIGDFDPEFFGIAPREARSMDPQQRLLLEVTWEALENAGISPTSLEGSDAGVFVGICTNEWGLTRIKKQDESSIDSYFASGVALSIASGRLSYVLGAQGPSVTLDSACSSSLVAAHLACKALRTRECSMAIAGGVNVLLSPEITIALSKSGMMAPDGRCKTFDAAADGYVRGEGCGMIVLKRLSDALADGNRIHAVIRGSAVNQDGPSSGLTVPNGPAQESVIRAALRDAGIAPGSVGYIEAHGTGTSLGDPIEIQALNSVLCRGRSAEDPLRVGSVKTNFGHLESAAGIAGLIKVALSLKHRELPPHLHMREPNPHIRWESMPIEVPTSRREWSPSTETTLVGGVSSFGFSGTNAHVILEEAPTPAEVDGQADRPQHVFAISAASGDALRELATRYRDQAQSLSDADLANVCHTASVGRGKRSDRLAICASRIAELRDALSGFVDGSTSGNAVANTLTTADAPRVAFLFSGQGAQYPRMAKTLYETQPVFRASLDRIDRVLMEYLGESVLAEMHGAGARLDQTGITQPALFAVEVALADLWRSWGLRPDAVIGHSVGEFAAAVVAGLLTLEDGARLISRRAELMQVLPDGGAMAAVFASAEIVEGVIAEWPGELSVAARNGPTNVVVSGAVEPLKRALEKFEARDIGAKLLKVSHAFHSPLMEPMLDEFERAAEGIVYGQPECVFISNVTGKSLAAAELDPSYWRRHVRETVRFSDGMSQLAERDIDVFLEIGPHTTLLGMGSDCVADGTWLPSLRREHEDWGQILSSLATLYVRGAPIDWRGFDEPYQRKIVDAPNYPFQRRRLWVDDDASPAARARASQGSGGEHVYLVAHPRSPRVEQIVFDATLDSDALPLLAEHRAFGTPVAPATLFFEAALAAAELHAGGKWVVENLAVEEALEVPTSLPVEAQVVLQPQDGKTLGYEFISMTTSAGAVAERQFRTHATGLLRPVDEAIADASTLDTGEQMIAEWLASGAEEIDPEQVYEVFASRGLAHGPPYRRLGRIVRKDGEVLAELNCAAESVGGFAANPALLDACVQPVALAAFSIDALRHGDDIYMPVGLERLEIDTSRFEPRWSHVVLRDAPVPDSGEQTTLVADFRIYDGSGACVASFVGLSLRRASSEVLASVLTKNHADWFYELAWRRASRTSAAASNAVGSSERIVVDSDGELGKSIVVAMENKAGRVTRHDYSAFATFEDSRDFFDALTGRGASPSVDVVLIAEQSADCKDGSEIGEALAPALRALLNIANALAATSSDGELTLSVVTQNTQSVAPADKVTGYLQSSLWGLTRVIGLEYPELAPRLIDVGDTSAVDADAVAAEIVDERAEDQVALRDDQRYVARIVPAQGPHDSSAQAKRLATKSPGILDGLELRPIERGAVAPDEVEIEVYATGLIFRDVLIALGMYPGADATFGGECSGRVAAVGANVKSLKVGDPVFGLVTTGFSTWTATPADLVVRKPEWLSFEDAAGIPSAFVTSWYALRRVAQLRKGESVLIHAATGGVGQAALQIAQDVGAEVFATAGSPEKRDLLRSQGVAHVFDSRSLDFSAEILRITDGRGVDVVLNSLAGDFMRATVETLNVRGRFLEIGKRDVWSQEKLQAVKEHARFTLIDIGSAVLAKPELAREMLKELIERFERSALRPLPRTDFTLDGVHDAFRYMQQAKHIGKVVVTGSAPRSLAPQAGGTYLITGGLGGLGLSVARQLVSSGARHLTLMGRSGPSEFATDVIEELKEEGARVEIEAVDVADHADLARALDRIGARGETLRGVVHAAGSLDDATLGQLDWTRFENVFAAKVFGAYNLHRLTEGMPLDFFVMFSSVAGLLGSPGQGNYAAANACLDGLANYRRRHGLPASSIAWGTWEEGGMAAGDGIRERAARRGLTAFTHADGRSAFESALQRVSSQIAFMNVDWSALFTEERPTWKDTFFSEVSVSASAAGVTAGAGSSTPITAKLAKASSKQRRRLLLNHVRQLTQAVLGVDENHGPNDSQALSDVGMDSLMAVELRNRLRATLESSTALPATLVFDYPSIEALTDYLLTLIGDEGDAAEEEIAAEGADDADSMLSSIEDLSDEEVERRLAERFGGVSDGSA